MYKKSFFIILIALASLLVPSSSYAAPGGVCFDVAGSSDCSVGEKCIAGAMGQGTCQVQVSGAVTCVNNRRCARGFVCTPTAVNPAVSTCQSALGAGGAGGVNSGTSIGAAFANNFKIAAPASLGGFVSGMLNQIYVIALILVLVYLVWGSYRYMMSGGDPKAVQAAKAQLTWAVVGMIIVFLSYGMFQLLNVLLNSIY
jgi:Type IV secretion system pilin